MGLLNYLQPFTSNHLCFLNMVDFVTFYMLLQHPRQKTYHKVWSFRMTTALHVRYGSGCTNINANVWNIHHIVWTADCTIMRKSKLLFTKSCQSGNMISTTIAFLNLCQDGTTHFCIKLKNTTLLFNQWTTFNAVIVSDWIFMLQTTLLIDHPSHHQLSGMIWSRTQIMHVSKILDLSYTMIQLITQADFHGYSHNLTVVHKCDVHWLQTKFCCLFFSLI
jgi:hypothetical protein